MTQSFRKQDRDSLEHPPPPAATTQGFIKGLRGGSLWNWALNEPPASEGGMRRPRQGLVTLSQREALLQEAAIVQLF